MIDGDTVDILNDKMERIRIRLAGIDAPERSQPFGARSRESLAELVFGKHVLVEYNKVDRYGRIVGRLIFNGEDVCLRQIQAGMAWHFKRYENEQPEGDRSMYAAAEQSAKDALIGLWSDPNSTPPWDSRNAK